VSHSRESLILCDRSLLDVICFARYYGVPIDEGFILDHCFYDQIFLCSPHDISVSDRLSAEDQVRRQALHEQFLLLLESIDIPVFELRGDSATRLLTLRKQLPVCRGTQRFLDSVDSLGLNGAENA
jgi:nicotinamide riboside kinase